MRVVMVAMLGCIPTAVNNGATVIGATVIGATVIGATVIGATVIGATVIGATVIGATVTPPKLVPISLRLVPMGSNGSRKHVPLEMDHENPNS